MVGYTAVERTFWGSRVEGGRLEGRLVGLWTLLVILSVSPEAFVGTILWRVRRLPVCFG